MAIIAAGLQVNINGEEAIMGDKALMPENPTARATFGEGDGFDQLLSKAWNEVVRAAIIHRIQNDVSKYSLLYAQDLIVWWGLQQSSEQISKAEILKGERVSTTTENQNLGQTINYWRSSGNLLNILKLSIHGLTTFLSK